MCKFRNIQLLVRIGFIFLLSIDFLNSNAQNDTIKLEFKNGNPYYGSDYIKAVMNNSYVRSYDNAGILRAEGKVYSDCGFLGEAKYYYPEGTIEHTEYWSFSKKKCPLIKSGTWTYFEKSGEVIKTKSYD